jgi:hypothetical protein
MAVHLHTAQMRYGVSMLQSERTFGTFSDAFKMYSVGALASRTSESTCVNTTCAPLLSCSLRLHVVSTALPYAYRTAVLHYRSALSNQDALSVFCSDRYALYVSVLGIGECDTLPLQAGQRTPTGT